jgi:hypothetical protein
MSVRIIIPFLGGDPDRERNLRWVLDRLDYPVTIAPGAKPWSKGAALYPAILACEAEIVVVHDADCWTDGLGAAVSAVAATDGPAWAVAHDRVHRLSRDATARLIAGADWRGLALDRPVYEGMAGGGIVCARRDVLLDAPMDPRFLNWGGEDESWGTALWGLHGPCWRGQADLVHLWHPPQPRINRRIGSERNWALCLRYKEARRDPAAMRELVGEAHRALEDAHMLSPC